MSESYHEDVAALQAGAVNLEETIEQFAAEINRMKEIEENMLNDSLWYGPNKAKFKSEFSEYMSAVAKLYEQAVDHLAKLQEIMKTYVQAETN